MLRQAGDYFVIGYGENIDVPTIDIISSEINFIGNLVGSYNDLAELMALTAQGKVTLHTSTYPLDAVNDAMARPRPRTAPGARHPGRRRGLTGQVACQCRTAFTAISTPPTSATAKACSSAPFVPAPASRPAQ